VGAGHGCIGCSERHFWDEMTPFYRRLPTVPGAGVQTTADEIGAWIVGGTAAAFAAHGVVSAIRAKARPIDESSQTNEEDR
jgi:hydrogenase small subunit